MQPKTMTKYGAQRGDCLDACIASLLEIDVDAVPGLSDADTQWHHKTREFLTNAGFACLWVHEPALKEVIITNALCIVFLKTDTPELHAIIGRWRSWLNGDDRFEYSVTEEFDPNEFKTYKLGETVGILLIFRSL